MARIQAKQIAEAILDGFDRHYRLFLAVTAEAKHMMSFAISLVCCTHCCTLCVLTVRS